IMSTPKYIYPIIILSDSDVEDTFSSTHSPDYIPTLSDYSLASLGNTSPNFLDDLPKDLLSTLSISLFHDDPYMKIIQAYDTIPPPQKISPPKDAETPVESPIPISPSSSVRSSSPVRLASASICKNEGVTEWYQHHSYREQVMSSSPHSTITSSVFDMENAFSTMNIHNYTSTLSPTSGSTSFNSSEDSKDDMIPPTSLLFYNNPYLKDVQAFYAKE
ncbi:hypothetical protein Tco_0872173, partial [Tanacetum coccineum]